MKCYRCKRTARHFIKFYTFAFFNPSGDEKITIEPICEFHIKKIIDPVFASEEEYLAYQVLES